jgi:23S rRNA (adenine2503-C2)-methyltransferase
MIDRMSVEGVQVGLAVSLHAPNDDLRSRLVPINRRYGLRDLLAAVDRYIERTNRRVTFEYALMRDVNDSAALAVELVGLLQSRLCHVNLIPFNPVPGTPYLATEETAVRHFANILRKGGIPTTVRSRRGIEISAGCGQLRRTQLNQGNEMAA